MYANLLPSSHVTPPTRISHPLGPSPPPLPPFSPIYSSVFTLSYTYIPYRISPNIKTSHHSSHLVHPSTLTNSHPTRPICKFVLLALTYSTALLSSTQIVSPMSFRHILFLLLVSLSSYFPSFSPFYVWFLPLFPPLSPSFLMVPLSTGENRKSRLSVLDSGLLYHPLILSSLSLSLLLLSSLETYGLERKQSRKVGFRRTE